MHFLKVCKKNQELDLLNSSLSDYGLCPKEWHIIKEDSIDYRIANKTEPDFFFRGRVKYEKGRKKWTSIQLAGL